MTLLLISLAILAVMAVTVWHHIRLDDEKAQRRGQDQNDSLIEGGFGGGGYGGGHSHVWRVTRDPQAYARGFVPQKVRNEDER